jgi:hypothetical protein
MVVPAEGPAALARGPVSYPPAGDPGQVVRLERSLLDYLTVDSSRPQRSTERSCSFEGGRVDGADGTRFVFTGPSPSAWSLRIPEPARQAEPEPLGRVLGALVRGLPGRARLQVLVKSTHRLVLAEGCPGTVVESRAWALLGNVVTPSGHVVPIGRSGRGSGLPELEEELASGELTRMLERIDGASPTPAGATPAVLAPPAAGVLVHEALGHFAEAAPDGRVDLSHRLGVRIATEAFHLADDATADGGAAHYGVDDDGVPVAGPTPVVREGRMVQLLHSRASARAMEVPPTANGRAASVWDPPIPRMSNLLCDPGEASEEELLDQMGNGVYVHSLAYGYGFGFRLEAQVRLAEDVRGGRRTGRFFTGGVLDEDRGVLTRAAELGDVAVYNRNAMCGKEGQLLYDVGTRSPAIRMTTLTLSA